MSRFILLAVVLAAISCTTTSGPAFKESKVVERIGNKDETPEWTTGETAMTEEKGEVIFVNQLQMSGNSRSENCLQGADLKGRSEMLRYIKDNITSSGQINELDGSSDPAVESLTAYLSQGQLHGVKVKSRYWEKVEVSDESGERVLKLRCAVQLAISKSELQRQLREATSKSKGDPRIREQLLQAQEKFINDLGDQQAH